MTNLEEKKIEPKETEREILLAEFEQLAHRIQTPSGLSGIKCSLSQWFSLNMTVLMQLIGYNWKKISAIKQKPIILNIGCGENFNKGYMNADLFPNIGATGRIVIGKSKLKCDLFINLVYPDKNLSEFADGILLAHVLEHIPPILAITSLKNCLAYLKVGGCIRISVPYLGAYDRSELPPIQQVENRVLAKNSLIYGWGHRFMYDSELLCILMEEAGFSEVKEVAFGQGLLGETDNPYAQTESIYVTGVKT